MLAGGFAPDTISSDLFALCVDGPAPSLPHVLSMFLLLGMSLDDAITLGEVVESRSPRFQAGDMTLAIPQTPRLL